jgi:hypothetical protein
MDRWSPPTGEVVIGSPPTAASATDPHLHRLLEWADEVSGGAPGRPETQRLGAALLHLSACGNPPDELA